MKTIVQFDLIKLGENSFCVDPNEIYVKGFFNLNMLNEFLTDEENYLKYIREDLEEGKPKTTIVEIWEDSDDYRTWIDYKLLPDDYEVE